MGGAICGQLPSMLLTPFGDSRTRVMLPEALAPAQEKKSRGNAPALLTVQTLT